MIRDCGFGNEYGSPIVNRQSAIRNRTVCVFLSLLLLVCQGCATPPFKHSTSKPSTFQPLTYKRRAMEVLKRGLQYEDNPVVRVQAAEALQGCGLTIDGCAIVNRQSSIVNPLPWLRAAMGDEHPAVRFACCAAVGVLKDAVAGQAIAACLDDPDPSVRLAAVFARHRLGHSERTGELADALLYHEDALVRRNAALLLGLLGEQGGVKILAKAMKDADEGVRHHALEAMAILGVEEAARQLCFLANSGVGSQEVFALNALARAGEAHKREQGSSLPYPGRSPDFTDTYRLKLADAAHVETRLAAARALGVSGHRDGYRLALGSLRSPRVRRSEPQDSPEGQRLRIRMLAASALGAIGDPGALTALADVIEENADPRLQISAAKAIIEIIEQSAIER